MPPPHPGCKASPQSSAFLQCRLPRMGPGLHADSSPSQVNLGAAETIVLPQAWAHSVPRKPLRVLPSSGRAGPWDAGSVVATHWRCSLQGADSLLGPNPHAARDGTRQRKGVFADNTAR